MGRIENVERAKVIARYLDHGSGGEGVVLVSLVSPYRAQREDIKETNNVLEVYVHTNETRGREKYHVENYEPPVVSYLDIDTTNKSIEDCVNEIFLIYREVSASP